MAHFKVRATRITEYEKIIEADYLIESLELAGEIPWDSWDELDDHTDFEAYEVEAEA